MVVPILVREIMYRPVETVTENTPLTEVAQQLTAMDDGAVVVVKESEPVGIVTRTNLVDALATGETDGVTAERIMSQPPLTVSESAPIQMGAKTLYEHDVGQALVMEGETVVGWLRAVDLKPYLPAHAVARPEEPLESEERDWEYGYDDQSTPGISVGDIVTFSKPITEQDLELFAEISGDKNRLHLDEAFAEQTRFKRRIVHGALASSVISAALSKLPGLVIYLSLDVTYSAPVEIGERVTARGEVITDLGHNRYRLAIEEFDENDTEVITGEATVLIDPLPEAEASV